MKTLTMATQRNVIIMFLSLIITYTSYGATYIFVPSDDVNNQAVYMGVIPETFQDLLALIVIPFGINNHEIDLAIFGNSDNFMVGDGLASPNNTTMDVKNYIQSYKEFLFISIVGIKSRYLLFHRQILFYRYI